MSKHRIFTMAFAKVYDPNCSLIKGVVCAFFLLFSCAVIADDPPAWPGQVPERTQGEGSFERLILRGAMLVDGTGAPPFGPVDIVVEGNRIAEIRNVGMGGILVAADRRPQADENTREFDLEGMYVLPGFIDLHGHVGGSGQGVSADYIFRLWMSHGVTTIRDPGSGTGI